MRPGAATTRVLLVVLAVALTAGLGSLGLWQLDRARQKEAAIAQRDRHLAAPPLDEAALLPATAADAAALRFRRALLAGRYDAAHQFLLDNRTHDGVAGYEVYTPLRSTADATVVLVNRGWVAAGPRRDRLPDIGVMPDRREVGGTLELPRAHTFLLGEAGYEGDAWPRVVQRIEPARIAALLDAPVAAVALRLDPAAPDGFLREWTPHLGISPERHRAYAFQWFALATTLAIIVVVLLRRTRRNKGEVA